jgi:hypothetical protein
MDRVAGRGVAGTVPRLKGRGERTRNPSGFSSPGKIRVFRRDVPESFEGDPQSGVPKSPCLVGPA